MIKKTITTFLSVIVLMMSVTVVSAADSHFLLSPTEISVSNGSFVYHNSDMRIQDTGWGGRYIVEFDAQLPPPASGAKYTQDFNWQGKNAAGTNIQGIAHSSEITASGAAWTFKSGGETITLQPQTEYHFWIAVDMINKTHSWSVTNSDTVIGSAENQAFKNSVANDISMVLCHDLRWGNKWLNKTGESTGEWATTQPQNVKISYDTTYASTSPEVTFGDDTIDAKATVFHNVKGEVYSPVLILCVYDINGSMIGVSANRLLLSERTDASPLESEIQTQIQTKFKPGITAKAMLIGALDNRLELVESTEEPYSEN